MKTCSKCGVEKELSEFASRKAAKNGKRAECKKCYNDYYKRYYSKDGNMDKHARLVYDAKKAYRWNLKQLKLESGCFICGYNKCATSLHFHHKDRNTKTDEVSDLVRNISYDKLKQEIDKCVILCSNCHGEVEEGLRVLTL